MWPHLCVLSSPCLTITCMHFTMSSLLMLHIRTRCVNMFSSILHVLITVRITTWKPLNTPITSARLMWVTPRIPDSTARGRWLAGLQWGQANWGGLRTLAHYSDVTLWCLRFTTTRPFVQLPVQTNISKHWIVRGIRRRLVDSPHKGPKNADSVSMSWRLRAT